MNRQSQDSGGDFEAIYRAPRRAALTICISRGGRLSISRALAARLSTAEVRLLLSRDRKRVVLDETGVPTFTLPKGGSTRAVELARLISAAGIALPARYEMEFDGKANVWRGCCRTEKAFPDVMKLAQKYPAAKIWKADI